MFDFNYWNKKDWLTDLSPLHGFPTSAATIQSAHSRSSIPSGVGQAALLRFDIKGDVENIGDITVLQP